MARLWRHPRTGVYYFRKGIPHGLRPFVHKGEPRHEYKKSLHTSDRPTAKRLQPDVAAACEEFLSELAARRGSTSKSAPVALAPPTDAPCSGAPAGISKEALKTLAGELARKIVADHADSPGPDRAFSLSKSFPPGPWGSHKDPWSGHRFVIIMGRRSRIPAVEQEYVRAPCSSFLAGRAITLTADDFTTLCDLARDPIDEALATLQRRFRGEESGETLEERYPSIAPVPPSVPFEILIDGWKAERKPRLATSEDYRMVFGRFAAFVKHDNAANVTPDDVVAWKDSLLAEDRLSTKTITKWLTSIRAVFGWATDNRRLPSNPAANVSVKTKSAPRTRSKGFSDDEARAILSAASAIDLTAKRESSTKGGRKPTLERLAARRWIPWLCCYSGARVAEIAQMRGADIRQIEGVWTMLLTPDAGSIKSDHYRIVPIHEHLIAQGFLEFVNATGEGPLFYDMARGRKLSPRKPPAQTVANKLAKWVRDIGVSDPRVAPNHGWRHRFATECRRNGVREGAEMALKGHAPRTVGEGYGEWPVATLAEEMAKLPRVTLSGPARSRKES